MRRSLRDERARSGGKRMTEERRKGGAKVRSDGRWEMGEGPQNLELCIFSFKKFSSLIWVLKSLESSILEVVAVACILTPPPSSSSYR